MEAVNGGSLGEDKGGPPPPSPLTGCYLLLVIGEPHSEEHKDIILQKVAKGLLSWDLNECLVDLEKELAIIIEQGLEGEEARYGERLIQFASENLVTEILIHPAVSTLSQCVRNLLSSFTRHRHIIHAGYTFQGNGSWALQDGTFSYSDFAEAFQEIEVQRVIHAYENGISIDLHCTPEGDWTRLSKEYFTKSCKVRVNPTDVLTTGSPSISSFTKYLEPFLAPTALEDILESSDVVGNIRFSRPTLYVFPGGQGDAALFGINGFNMLLDGGYSRKACFWDFVRHLDRLDAVLMTRLNNSSVSGVCSVLKRKKQGAVYPQVGHFFCNIQERKSLLSPDGDKDKDPLIISLIEEGQNIIQDLRYLNLSPQSCYRESDPIILYHKVGHGTLNMYVLSPDKNSREVREFLQKWNQSDPKLFTGARPGKDFSFPLQNLVSICALLVWQPANPSDTITRILYPGSTPQRKIFEGLDRLKGLEYMKQPICTVKSVLPVKKSKQDVIDKLTTRETKAPIIGEKKIENRNLIEDSMKNGEMNGDVINKDKHVKKSDSLESDKEKKSKKIEDVRKQEETKKAENVSKVVENGERAKQKPRPAESKPRSRGEGQQKKKAAPVERKGPPTPKKSNENGTNGDAKERKIAHKPSPSATPAKSTKDANNRKVIENKKTPAKKEAVPKQAPSTESKPKVERKPISRRPKTVKGPPSPLKKMTNGVQKPDSLSKRGKLDKEGTTDSSTVSTPSADQESILKKDISKLTPEEIQQLKDKEIEELKEEQDAIKEIEAVFRKGEGHVGESEPGVRKIKEISIDDNLDTEEYLIIEKEEIEHDSLDQEAKEDEMQKLVRDSEESEKQRKLSGEEEDLKDQLQEKRPSQAEETNIQEHKESEDLDSKKQQIISSEEKAASLTDKKELADEEVKEVVESHPEEKVSANIESGATTTAPTLPEDERITLDEIKEDNGQPIEEKHVKEETKEKEVPIIQLPPKSQQDSQSKQPPVVGIPLDKQKHVRDIVKTPDEVADLPVHEEADYHEFHGDEKKSNEVDAQKQDKEDKAGEKKEEKEFKKTGDTIIIEKPTIQKIVTEDSAKHPVEHTHDSKEIQKEIKHSEVVITTTQPLQSESITEGKQAESDTKIKDPVIEAVSSLATKEVEKSDILEKAEVETKEKSDQDNNLFLQEDKLKESIDDEWVVISKEEEKISEVAQEADKILHEKQEDLIDMERQLVETEDLQHALKDKMLSDFIAKEVEQELRQRTEEKEKILSKHHKEEVIATESKIDKELVDSKATEEKDIDSEEDHISQDTRQEDEIGDILENDKEDIKALIEEADKKTIDEEPKQKDDKVKKESKEDTQLPSVKDEQVIAIKESRKDIAAIEDKLKELKKEVTVPVEEVQLDKVAKDLTKIEKPPQTDIKQELNELAKIDDKLNELKSMSAELAKENDEVKVEKSMRSPEHAESVVLSDSSPEEDGPRILKDLDIDKSALGRKSPAEREEDVIKIVVSVAEVLKSEAPLEELKGKLPFTQELRETHITTQDSPILEAKIIKTDDIPPIPEEPHEEETKPERIEEDNAKETVEQSQNDNTSTEDKLDKEDDVTVHRMLVTTSSEDGGEEIEICPAGTITFSRSSESSGRSSPEPSQKTPSQKSSIVETISDTLTTVKQLTEKNIEAEDKDLDTKKVVSTKHSSEVTTEQEAVLKEEIDKVYEVLSAEKSENFISETAIVEGIKTDVSKEHIDDQNHGTFPKMEEVTHTIKKEEEKKLSETSQELAKEKVESSDLQSTSDIAKRVEDVKPLPTNKDDELPKQEGIKSPPKEIEKISDVQVDTKSKKLVEEHIKKDIIDDLHTAKEMVASKDAPNDITSNLDKISHHIEETIQKEQSRAESEKTVIEKPTEVQTIETVEIAEPFKEGAEQLESKKAPEVIAKTPADAPKIEQDLEHVTSSKRDDSKPPDDSKPIGDPLSELTHTDSKAYDEKISQITKTTKEEGGDDGEKPVTQRRTSIIEKAQEFIEKSEEALEEVFASMGNKVHSILDDLTGTESDSKTKDESTNSTGKSSSLSQDDHIDISPTPSTKSVSELKDLKEPIDNLISKDDHDERGSIPARIQEPIDKVHSKDDHEEKESISAPVQTDVKDTQPREVKDGIERDAVRRRSSIIEVAEEFLEKCEKTLETGFSAIGETSKSVLRDILPEDDIKTDTPLPSTAFRLDVAEKKIEDKAAQESKELKSQASDKAASVDTKREIDQQVDEILKECSALKEAEIKAGEEQKEVVKKDSTERRGSIIEVAEAFIEKSEKTLESVFSSIGGAAQSVLHDFLPDDQTTADPNREQSKTEKELHEEKSGQKIENSQKGHQLDEEVKESSEPKQLDIKETVITSEGDKKEIEHERRSSIIGAAEEFIEKSEKTLESVFSSVGGAVQSVMHDILPEDKTKAEPSAEKTDASTLRDQPSQDVQRSEKLAQSEKETSKDIHIIMEDKPKQVETSVIKSSESEDLKDGKVASDGDKIDILGKDTSERRGSIIEATEDFIEKSEKTLESAFSAIGDAAKSVFHDILQEDDIKTSEVGQDKIDDSDKSKKEQLTTAGKIVHSEVTEQPKKEETKITDKIDSGESKTDKDTSEKKEKDIVAISENVDLSTSIVKSDDIKITEKGKKEPVKDIIEPSNELSKEAISSKKDQLIDEFKVDKDTLEREKKQIDEEVAQTKCSYEDLSKLAEQVKLDKETIKKEEKEIDDHVSETIAKVSDFAKSVPFDKYHISDDVKQDNKERGKADKESVSKADKTTVSDEFKVDKETLRQEEQQIEAEVDEVKQNYEELTKTTESIAFEKVHPSDEYKVDKETVAKEEKQIESEVKQISENIQDVSDLAKSTLFEKCHPLDATSSANEQTLEKSGEFKVDKDAKEKEKTQSDEKLDKTKESPEDLSVTKSTDKLGEFKVDKTIIQKDEKEIDDQVMHVSETVDKLSDLARSVSFEKCRPPDEFKVDKKVLENEEKQIEGEVSQIKETYEGLSKLNKSISFDKCKPTNEFKVDKDVLEKDEKQIDEEVDQLKRSYEDLSKLTESVSFDKCKFSDEYKVEKEILEKEEKQIDEEVGHLKKSYEDLSKLTESVSFNKCKFADEYKVEKEILEKEEKQIDEEVGHLKKSYEDLSKLTESVSFNKCKLADDFKVEKEILEKEEKQIDEEVDHLKKSYEDLSELTESVSFDKCKSADDEFKVKKHILEKEEKHMDGVVEELRKSYEDLSKLTDSTLFDKCQPPHAFKGGDQSVDSNKAAHLIGDEKKDKEKVDTKIERKDHLDTNKITQVETDGKKTEIPASKAAVVLDEQPVSSQTEKCEKESMEKTSFEKDASLKIDQTEHKKLSISDVEISIKTDIDHKDSSRSFLDNERSVICDSTDAKVYTAPSGDSISQDGSSIASVQTSTETETKSDKSSPDMELSGKTTPPTVPISPVAKDIKSPSLKLDSGLSEQTETDEEDLSTKSQVAHSQSDFDELDMKMDPMSMSFYGALPEEQLHECGPVAATYLYEITKAKYTKDIKLNDAKGGVEDCQMSLMTASFIGELPSSSTEAKPSESKHDGPKKDAVDSWGKPLGLPAPTYLYETTKAKFSSQPKETDLMTASFIGELPTASHAKEKEEDPMTTSVYFGDGSDYDPIASWGKPLGLPSPAPPNNNEKGTPKKEKKLPAYVSAKNKLNDDKKRAESPSKLKAKKVNPVYVDLTYVPHHGNHYYSYVDFFRRIRARYYVFSGLEPSRQVYDALLEAKQTWEDKELDVTIIPTYDTDILGYWVAENEELLSKFKVDLAPSASRCTINLQDHETSCSAYRLEF